MLYPIADRALSLAWRTQRAGTRVQFNEGKERSRCEFTCWPGHAVLLAPSQHSPNAMTSTTTPFILTWRGQIHPSLIRQVSLTLPLLILIPRRRRLLLVVTLLLVSSPSPETAISDACAALLSCKGDPIPHPTVVLLRIRHTQFISCSMLPIALAMWSLPVTVPCGEFLVELLRCLSKSWSKSIVPSDHPDECEHQGDDLRPVYIKVILARPLFFFS